MRKPNDPQPHRAYDFPSCNACCRIAERRGLTIGARLNQGRIEAFTHNAAGVQAVVMLTTGVVTFVPV